MGCGLLFSSSGEAETAYFTRNGEIIGWVPVPSADLVYPMVAATAPGVVRLDFAAPAPSVPSACKIGARTFSNLALAASAAREGDVISVSRGLHALAEGLKIRKDITIQGKGEQQTVLRLYGGFIVTSTSAQVLPALCSQQRGCHIGAILWPFDGTTQGMRRRFQGLRSLSLSRRLSFKICHLNLSEVTEMPASTRKVLLDAFAHVKATSLLNHASSRATLEAESSPQLPVTCSARARAKLARAGGTAWSWLA